MSAAAALRRFDVPHGADVLGATLGGGGRAAAAGVDALPTDRLNGFVASFGAMPWEAWLPVEHP